MYIRTPEVVPQLTVALFIFQYFFPSVFCHFGQYIVESLNLLIFSSAVSDLLFI